ncbi:hypothetical protein PG996_000550 [Apiospora saccharicola]|uniref:Uncharacterized protein n=1 Tax=Apiospora saccharicola TaxID=335842 RepID=A0ABR1WHY2_9PEZI
MCLPCWPVKDIVLEDDPPARRRRLFQYVWDAEKREWVPTIGHRWATCCTFDPLAHLPSIPTPYLTHHTNSSDLAFVPCLVPEIRRSPDETPYLLLHQVHPLH